MPKISKNRPATASKKVADHPILGNILALTHVLSNQIGRAFDKKIEIKFGLSLAEWRVMMTLALDPGATSVAIINSWAMDKMAISRAVARLEERGFVHRKKNAKDRRSYSLSLTPKGKRAYHQVLPHANARYHELLSSLSSTEIASLRKSLEKLNKRAIALAQDEE